MNFINKPTGNRPKNFMMQRLSKLIALMMLLAATYVFAADIYKWKDKSGNIFYGQVVPADGELIELAEPPPPPSLETSRANPQKELQDSLKERKRKQQLQQQANVQKDQAAYDEAACQQARDHLVTLQTFRRARAVSDDGTPVMMSEEERQGRIQQAQQTIGEVCK